jgi:3-dehydroquinate dehydratase II
MPFAGHTPNLQHEIVPRATTVLAMTTASILVINGPNLNLLGTREPSIYGQSSLDDHLVKMTAVAAQRGFNIHSLQSNSESEIVGAIHDAAHTYAGIVINAGAFTHYSWAIHDALRSFSGKIVEVHLSNPAAREDFRQISVLAGVVDGSISGFGGLSYVLAVEALANLLA